ncbi:interleukin-11 [Protopterus annectens]|uniref:interleukin-11 n=1 Tax=Protopterus annectens TaxID=7888 RepID=UPI001CFAFEBB|nr:interleukin-11 [Protopterus annectens]
MVFVLCEMKRNYHMLGLLMSLITQLSSGPVHQKPKQYDFRVELQKMIKYATHLLADTKLLYNDFKNKYPAEGEHKLDTLPVLSGSAADITTLEVTSGLQKLRSDLHSYKNHLDWLKKAAHIVKSPLSNGFHLIHIRTETLANNMENMMTKLKIPYNSTDVPHLPPHSTHWAAVQAGHAIFHDFILFLDWTVRALMVLRNKL